MSSVFVFPCPACDVRIKAPVHLLGLRRNCPACRVPLVVRPQKPPCSPAEFLNVITPIAASPGHAAARGE
jgi:hypothetical protein